MNCTEAHKFLYAFADGQLSAKGRAKVRSHIEALQDIMLDELNVKRVDVGEQDTALASLSAKADFKKLGPRFGPKVKQVAGAVAKLSSAELEPLLEGQTVDITLQDGESASLTEDDLVIERLPLEGLVVASEGSLVVGLDTEVTPELEIEGLAREFVNKVQNMRKTADFDVTQRVRITFKADERVRNAVSQFDVYIRTETLALVAGADDALTAESATAWDLNGCDCLIAVEPAEG